MNVVFEKEYLRDLYEKGRSKDKKHRFQPNVISAYIRGVNYLKWASRKEDLYNLNSLHFEALSGDRQGRFSIRAGLQYRIEFTLAENSEEPLLTICNIVELSNHYK